MALSAFKTYSAGEILTAADLNSSFSRIHSNGEDLATPATKAHDMNGFELILDADADTSITSDSDDVIDWKIAGTDAIFMGHGDGNTGSYMLIDPTAFSATASTNIGLLRVGNTNIATIPAGTTAIAAGAYFEIPNWTADGTITASANVYIEGAASEGSADYSLWVDAGETRLDGTLTASGGGALTGTWTDLGTVSTMDLDGGSIDGVTIGAAAAPTVTDLGSVATCDINGGSIDGAIVGAASAAAGTFVGLNDQSAQGALTRILTAETELTEMSGATETASSLIPNGALLVGLSTRITTTIAGCTSISIGDADPDRYGSQGTLTANATTSNVDWTVTTVQVFNAAADVVITAVGGATSFSSGAIRITAHYIDTTAATA